MIPVAVIDTGLANLDSITRALERCGGAPVRVRTPAELESAERIVLPGVGAFGAGMESLRASGLAEAVCAEARAGAPVLGLCLGMQLLTARSEESEGVAGLGLIPGEVVRLTPGPGERVPHMGWNVVEPVRDDALFAEVAPATDFYFVHSYHVVCEDEEHMIATTPYCGGFVSAVRSGAVVGAQFHPEKSQAAGFALLRAFVAGATAPAG